MAELVARISRGTVNRRETPWMLKTPVTASWNTWPLRALAGSFMGLESVNVAFG